LSLLARKCLERGVRVEAILGSITALPYADEYFDGGILMMNVLYSIPDYLRALSEISRVTRAGAVLTVSGPMPGIDVTSFLKKALEEITDIDTNPEVREAWRVVSNVNEKLLTNPRITHQFTAAQLAEILLRFGFRAYLSNQDHFHGMCCFVAAVKQVMGDDKAIKAHRDL
jgi:ubiquinone/menaquinone biosynthesis C-methylase UbiE